MDYRDIVFLNVAENLSFSKAAGNLCISQPAVTKHIKELESRYKVNLFDRKGNKIFLTRAGELVYNSLKKIDGLYRDLDFEVSKISNTSTGEFVLGASSTISQYVIPKVMASFHKRYPGIKIHLINGNSFDMEQLLLSNKIDMALVENESSQSDIRYTEFMDDELITVTGANSVYAKRRNIGLEDFRQFPIVLREVGSGTLEVVKSALVDSGLDFEALNTHVHLGSTESIKNFLLDFDGIAVVSEQAVANELYMNRLIKLNVSGLSIPRKFRIALNKGYESSMVRVFIDFLLQYNF
ncbi:MAG: LysR family transcriptional regulator [Bacteroidales bacterium]|jgi:DNA-binding transcriptional LysR family regulator|nr:LysR family transcriptional regulator [Bacteroidales bacterium]